MFVRAEPGPRLAPFVRAMWWARTEGGATERILPTGAATVCLRLEGDGPIVDDAPLARASFGGPRLTAYRKRASESRTIRVGATCTPAGAAALLGVPADGVAGAHGDLGDVWGKAARDVIERIGAETTPRDALRRFEAELTSRIAHTDDRFERIQRATDALERAGTRVSMTALASHVGWSPRRFREHFRRAVGIAPDAYGQLVRFRAASDALARSQDGERRLVDVALAAGYSDQAHFSREFRRFAGYSPSAYRAIDPRWPQHARD